MCEDVDEGLDVVDRRRLAEQPDLDREGRLVPRLAALALDRFEERRLLAADVGAGAAPELDVEVAEEDVRVARPAAAIAWRQTRLRQRVLAADVDERLRRPDREGRDGDRFDDGERVALHQDAVAERPGSDSSALQTR